MSIILVIFNAYGFIKKTCFEEKNMGIKKCFGYLLICVGFVAAATITPKKPSLKDGCYQIGTAKELFGFAEILNQRSYDNPALVCAKLTDNIVINKNVLDSYGDLNPKAQDLVAWTPVSFAGLFDGNGKTISGLYVNDTTLMMVGLFSGVGFAANGDSAVVKDLGIEDSYFYGKYQGNRDPNIGSIFATTTTTAAYIKISNCYTNATIEGWGVIGGLVGWNGSKMIIENSHNSGKIRTKISASAGGLVGNSGNDTLFIINSYNSANIKGGGSAAGLASTTRVLQVKNSYNSGNLSSDESSVAGLIGSIQGIDRYPRIPEYSNIIQSYNTGKLYSATGDIGGLVTTVNGTELNIINSYSEGDFSDKYIDFQYGYDGLVVKIKSSELNLINSFYTQQTIDSTKNLKPYYQCDTNSTCNIINSYALSESGYKYDYSVTSKELEDGSIALKLHNYKNDSIGIDGSIWGQNVGKDVHPLYTGVVEFNTVEAHITPTIPALVDGCYEIGNADELYGFAAVVNGTDSTSAKPSACGKLTADIVVNERLIIDGNYINERGRRLAEWTPINDFEGIFDGQNHIISGLYNYQPKGDSVGFFNHTGKQSITNKVEIKNLGFKDSYVKGITVGGFVGRAHSSIEISNSFFEGIIEGDYTSGFIGHANEFNSSSKQKALLSIKNCHNRAIFNTLFTAAGLVQNVDNYKEVRIENCSNTSKLLSKRIPTTYGLIAYFSRSNVSIVNSYNASSVIDPTYYNGFVGFFVGHYNGETIAIRNSYDVGDLSKKFLFKGLLYNEVNEDFLTIDHCFYRTDSISNNAGSPATLEEFENGTIAAELHNYKKNGVDGSVWGQNVGTDPIPTLSGTIKGYAPTISKLVLHTFEGDTVEYVDYYVEGHKIYPPKPERDGYLFAGWYDNEKREGDAILAINTKDSGDINLYAKWFELKTPKLVDGCFEIGTAEELYQFAYYVNDTTRTNLKEPLCAKLTADIDVNKNVLASTEALNEDASNFIRWEPIQYFGGTFDGQGHSISGLYFYDMQYYKNVGLFGSINSYDFDVWKGTDTTTIKDLTLKDSYFEAMENVAGIAGQITRLVTVFENVHNEALVKAGQYAGGLVGRTEYNGYPVVLNSSNKGNIHAVSGTVAGLVGYSLTGTRIKNSYNAGNIYGGGSGGLGGYIAGDLMDDDNGYSLIEFSYNSGLISGETNVGGLFSTCKPCKLIQTANEGTVIAEYGLGGLSAELTGDIYNSYNAGKIKAETEIGGLVGHANSVNITNSFNTQEIPSGNYNNGGVIGDYEGYLVQNVTNSFFINADPDNNFQQIQVTAKDFADGTVLKALQDYTDSVIDGKCWIQNIGKDAHPVLKGMTIIAISSSSETSSSSSEAKSSSSVTSSSSDAKSSSSSVKETSSSSEGAKSSSSKEPKSSSSGKNSIVESLVLDFHYNLSIDHRIISITGIPANTYVALFDMNGTLVDWKLTESNGATLAAPRSGRYIVRIKAQNQSVIVK